MKQARKTFQQCVTKSGTCAVTAISAKGLSSRVTFGDLNLNRAADAATLFARIYAAALADAPRLNRWLQVSIERESRSQFQAVARGVALGDAPQLMSYYEAMIRRV